MVFLETQRMFMVFWFCVVGFILFVYSCFFVLFVQVAWPLNEIITESCLQQVNRCFSCPLNQNLLFVVVFWCFFCLILQYSKIFSFLLRLRRADYELKSLWKLFATYKRRKVWHAHNLSPQWPRQGHRGRQCSVPIALDHQVYISALFVETWRGQRKRRRRGGRRRRHPLCRFRCVSLVFRGCVCWSVEAQVHRLTCVIVVLWLV